MNVVRFGSEDVIATSDLTNGSKMTFSNFANGDITDNKITFDYKRSFSFDSTTTADDVINAIGANSSTQIYSAKSKKYYDLSVVMGNIINNGDTSSGTWDYMYVYDSTHNRFAKQ